MKFLNNDKNFFDLASFEEEKKSVPWSPFCFVGEEKGRNIKRIVKSVNRIPEESCHHWRWWCKFRMKSCGDPQSS